MKSAIRAPRTCLMNPSEPGEAAHGTDPKAGLMLSMGAADLFMRPVVARVTITRSFGSSRAQFANTHPVRKCVIGLTVLSSQVLTSHDRFLLYWVHASFLATRRASLGWVDEDICPHVVVESTIRCLPTSASRLHG